MNTTTGQIIVGLDIGTTKISAIVGRKNEYGKIEILGMGRTESLGVMRGMVSNIEKTVQSIREAVDIAEEKSGHPIKEVYVGIAGQHIRSLQHRGTRMRKNLDDEISRHDVKSLIEDMRNLALNPGEEMIHVIPQDYNVDNEQGIKEPVGMSGVRLEANFHIIAGQMSAIKNIYKCVRKAGLEVKDLVLEPLASSASVLTPEELEAGVALVDIGGGTTDIAIFQDDIIRHTAVIPFGGNVVTEDIKMGLKIMRKYAEQLKVKFGSALASAAMENEIVAIPGLKGHPSTEISLRNLSNVIQARMEEIIEHVYYEIKNSGFEDKLIGGIVVTGGGSMLKNLVQLMEYVTGMQVRIGYPTEHITKTNLTDIQHPMHATGIGLIIKGYEDLEDKLRDEVLVQQPVEEAIAAAEGEDPVEMVTQEEETTRNLTKPRGGWFNRILDSTKKFFDDDETSF